MNKEINFEPIAGYIAVEPREDIFKDSKIQIPDNVKKQMVEEFFKKGELANKVIATNNPPQVEGIQPSDFKVGDYIMFGGDEIRPIFINVEGTRIWLIRISEVLGKIKDIPRYVAFEKTFWENHRQVMSQSKLKPKRAQEILDAEVKVPVEKPN